MPGKGITQSAAIITLTTFSGLTLGVFLTKNDFSFLRPALGMGMLAFLGVIAASLLFGFSLGVFFCFVGVALVCGYILYYTSNVLHHYRTHEHVGAALELFACVALLFWYVMQIVMHNGRD